MGSSAKAYTVREFGGFVRGMERSWPNHQPLPVEDFDALESFILANRSETDVGPVDLLSLAVRKGGLKTITARNYVGLLALADGTVIEILPKIHGHDGDDAITKRILLQMLKTLRDAPFKDFNTANLKVDRLSLLEIFITMFVTQVATLVKQGLKSTYRPVENNERFFRGKLKVAEDIKRNSVTKGRVFVAYDEWSLDRPENRLLRSALSHVRGLSRDRVNQVNISRLLTHLDDVPASPDHKIDFSLCTSDRAMSHYHKAIAWCRIFLLGNSFTAYSGSQVAVALLFPMDKVFESFVAARLRWLGDKDAEVSSQDTTYSLFDQPKRFQLRPDVVVTRAGKPLVIDTKWKVLSQVSNFGIAQADMYQMYAYAKKYDAERVTLLYPLPDDPPFSGTTSFHSNDGVRVDVRFVDLLDPDPGLACLLDDPVASQGALRPQ